MSYESYKAYLSIANSPMQQYKDDLQATINSEFECASNIYTIQEELNKGDKTFTDVVIRINHVINSETGEKLGDDWRGITFKDLQHNYGLGYMYQFDDNYWLTINSDIYKFVTASTCIRRCNNVLSRYLYDENNNRTLYTEPCIIDYKISRDLFKYSDEMILPEGIVQVTTQNNDNTKTIKINDRFIFNGQPFKVQRVNSYLRDKTMVADSVPLLYFSMFKDQISPQDDIDNNIADGLIGSDINTVITISPNETKILQDDTQAYSVYKYDSNNNKLNDTFTITASGCDSSYYTLTIIDGNNFSIKNIKGDGGEYLTVTCTDTIDNTSENITIRLAGEW